MLWSFAKLSKPDEPLFNALAVEAIRHIFLVGAQGMANIVWAFSTCGISNYPLLDSISSASIKSMNDFSQ